MNKRPKTVMYARYSTEDQHRSFNADQISDAFKSKPTFTKLLDFIERNPYGIKGVVMEDRSRLCRRIIDDLIAELPGKW